MKKKIMENIKRLFRDEDGQGMTEYIIIVAIIAIAGIAIFTLFGDQIRDVVFSMGKTLGGEDTDVTQKMQEGEVEKKMGKF